MRILFGTLFMAFMASSLFGLVSITPVEIGENAGFHTKIGLSLQTQRGNTDKDDYRGEAKFLYDNNISYVTFIEFSGEYGKTNSIEDTNNIYIHYRYIHTLMSEVLRGEFFLQTQEDKFKEIEYRRLAGLGLRIKMDKFIHYGTGYIGIGAFFEDKKYLNESESQKYIVLNNYIAYSIAFSENTTLAYRLDYQPVIDDFANYVVVQKLSFVTKINEKLDLTISMVYDVASIPAEGVDKNNFSQITGFVYSF